MRVVLVNPPNNAVSAADLAPPVWALLLGAIARAEGCDVRILDFNRDGLEQPGAIPEAFYEAATESILAGDPDLVAFSSMGVNSHICLELARRIKTSGRPRVILGGAHFSSISREVMARYPWIDGVCIGEGERPFRELLRSGRDWIGGADAAIAGMILRNTAGIADQGTAQIPGEDEIPAPAYDLVDLPRYFRLNPRRLVDIDAASRGCRWSCGYCYSPGHFKGGGRAASHERFLSEWKTAYRHSFRSAFVVQDNLVNSPAATIELCREIAQVPERIVFHCYATLAQLTDPVIDAMAAAGCRGVYVGVDMVHPADRLRFAKKLYSDEPDMLRRAESCRAAGIVPTLAFIVKEVDSAESRAEFEATAAAALFAAAAGFPIRLNTLMYYPGTPAFASFRGEFRACDLKPRLTMDLPEAVRRNPFACDAPNLFPFHATHRPAEIQGPFLLAIQALFVLANCHPAQLLAFARRGRCWDLLKRLTDRLDPETVAGLSVEERSEAYLSRFRDLLQTTVRRRLEN